MVPDITIRRAQDTDITGIQQVAQQSWHETYGRLLGEEAIDELLAEGYSESFLGRALDAGELTLFVAEDEYSIIGYVSCEPPTDDDIGQVSIYVSPDYWGEGIGTQLLEKAESYLGAQDARALQDVVLAGNDIGNAFYRKHFERTDETTVEVGDEEFAANVYREEL
jgi:ribosomal protein S18 acetylase RimI-like enzyme